MKEKIIYRDGDRGVGRRRKIKWLILGKTYKPRSKRKEKKEFQTPAIKNMNKDEEKKSDPLLKLISFFI